MRLAFLIFCAPIFCAPSFALDTNFLKADWRASTGVTTNSGGLISFVADQSTNGYGLHQTTNKPALVYDAQNRAAMQFGWGYSTAHPKNFLHITNGLTGNIDNLTVYVVSTGPYSAIETSSVISFVGWAFGWIKLQMLMYRANTSTGLKPGLNASVFAISGGGEVRWGTNKTTIAATSSTALTGGGFLGMRDGDEHFSGLIYRVLVYATNHNAASMDAISGELASSFSLTTNFAQQVACGGNSITEGVTTTELNSYPWRLSQWKPWLLVHNIGEGGAKIGTNGSGMYLTHATYVDDYYSTRYGTNWISFKGGINDLNSDGVSATVCFQRLTNYVVARTSAHPWRIIVSTIADSEAGAADTNIYGAYNVAIRGGGPWHVTADPGLHSAFETRFNQGSDTTWFSDGIHPNNRGAVVLANHVSHALGINTWYVNSVSGSDSNHGTIFSPFKFAPNHASASGYSDAISLLSGDMIVAQGNSFYVDNAATGARDGTSWANAWTNLANVAGISEGDTVYISGGSSTKTYQLWSGSFYEWVPATSGGNGTASNPINYRIGQDSGHNGIAIFDGSGLTSPSGRLKTEGWRYGVISGDYNGENHIVFTNCGAHLGDSSLSLKLDHVSYYEGMRFNNCTNMELSFLLSKPPGLTSVNIQWDVYPLVGEPASYTNNVIRNSVILMPQSSNTPSLGADGISGGTSTWVKSNYFTTYRVTNDVDWQHNDAWQNLGSSNCRIEANVFENIGSYALYWECIQAVLSIANVWEINNVYRFTNGYILTNSSAVAVTIGPQGASGQTYSNIVSANSTFADHWRFPPVVFGQTTTTNTWKNSVLANHLFINSKCAVILNRTNGSAYDNVTNGIFFGYNKGIAKTDGDNTFTPAQMVTPAGDSNLQVVNYVRLAAFNLHLLGNDTAAINVGFDMSSFFATDADGFARTGVWDIGAYEFQPTATPGTIPSSIGPGRGVFISTRQ